MPQGASREPSAELRRRLSSSSSEAPRRRTRTNYRTSKAEREAEREAEQDVVGEAEREARSYTKFSEQNEAEVSFVLLLSESINQKTSPKKRQISARKPKTKTEVFSTTSH